MNICLTNLMGAGGTCNRTGASCHLITATERVRVVSSVDVSCQFTTPRPIPVAFGATACAVTPVLTSRRSELAPGIYATDRSHQFSCSFLFSGDSSHPFCCSYDPRPIELPVDMQPY